MLYRIGTAKEILAIPDEIPEIVQEKLYHVTAVLDEAYGAHRDYLCSGGYSLLGETKEDVDEMRSVINFENHPCEWADRLEDYLCALYLLNDDFSIVVLMPIAVAPKALKKELED